MKVAGIDGYKDGWIAVVVDSGDFSGAGVDWDSDLGILVRRIAAERSVVDIPIGLSSGPSDRPVETCVRGFMPGKSSSVFNSPCRQALKSGAYDEASETNRQILGKKLSKQTWAIMPKIKEADTLAQEIGQIQMNEGHPEVSFTICNNRKPILAGKKSMKGLLARIGILAEIGFDLSGLAALVPDRHTAAPDDLIDAAILAWSANRVLSNQHTSFPQSPTKDEAGLEMAILA